MTPVWYRRDSLPIYFLAVVLAVLSFVVIFNVQKTYDAVKQSDVIANCFTPGTRCSDLAAANQKRQAIERQAGFHCLILTRGLLALPVQQQFEEFDECYKEQIKLLSEE